MTVLDRVLLRPEDQLLPQAGEASATTVRPAAMPPANDAIAEQASVAQAPTLSERRAEALRAMFPLLFSMGARRSDLWQAIAVERYLSQATHIADLEQRIQEVHRRRNSTWS